MHGPKGSRRKQSDYAVALAEKQKLRYQYGLLERQFRRYFKTALTRRGVTGETLLQLLETRLDNVVFRLGFANSRSAARQMVSHGHVQVNGRKVDISSYNVKPGDDHGERQAQLTESCRSQSRAHANRSGSRLADVEQRAVQRSRGSHPDARRNRADRQRAVDRRVVLALSAGGSRGGTNVLSARSLAPLASRDNPQPKDATGRRHVRHRDQDRGRPFGRCGGRTERRCEAAPPQSRASSRP